ncbi:GNAT family N-acetyltransferase [Candidatus Bathyarchaeota archaeon]|nr:GNAT family N-acetyltransferase [Candidatus Bathyarchaeota archaeon]
MDIVSVAGGYEKMFWNYVNRDPLDYYFFIVDWTQRRERTKIFLAIEGEEVLGALLIYADYIVQFRGSREAVRNLLEYANLEKVELQAPSDCEDIVCQKYKPHVKQDMVLMCLNRGEEHIHVVETPARLSVGDAEEVAALMRRCDPEWWGEITGEQLKQRWESLFWLGIKLEAKLVSVGNTRFVDFASNIGVVATDEHYRSRGYATSIVSALVQEILKRSPIALIHVIADNAPAVRAYSKVGFKPYKIYLSIRS